MRSSIRPAAGAVAGVALLAAGVWLAPPALNAAALLVQQDDPEAITAYRLKAEPPARIATAIEQALTDSDPELAASLLEIATELATPLPDDLAQRVIDAQGFNPGRLAGDIWSGITTGDVSSEAALGGTLAADLSGIGDVRDLIIQGNGYLTDGSYDPVVLTLATAGLALTVATVVTVGAAAPARTGVTILKASKKAGHLPAPLVAEFVTLSRNAINRGALDETLTLARQFDLSGAGAASARVLRPAVLDTVTRTADDVAAIAGGAGYRAVNQSIRLADSTADISKLRRLAATTGTRFRGTLALLGSSALTVAGLLLTLSGWAITGLLWLLAAGFAVIGLLRRLIGWALRARPRARPLPR